LLLVSFFLSSSAASRTPPSFPTRRSSDLLTRHLARFPGAALIVSHDRELLNEACQRIVHLQDGKLFSYEGGYDSFERQLAEKQRSEETRLNSSHVKISYAVFCLKKKNKKK